MFFVAVSSMGSYYYFHSDSIEDAKERVVAASREYGFEFEENSVYLLEHFSIVEEFNEEYLSNEEGETE